MIFPISLEVISAMKRVLNASTNRDSSSATTIADAPSSAGPQVARQPFRHAKGTLLSILEPLCRTGFPIHKSLHCHPSKLVIHWRKRIGHVSERR